MIQLSPEVHREGDMIIRFAGAGLFPRILEDDLK
jgi:hypothetical protein